MVAQPVPVKVSVTLYTPVVVAVGVNEGEIFDAPVVVAIPGPRHV